MLQKVLWILLLTFLIQLQETEQKSFYRRHNNGKKSSGHTAGKHSRPFLRRKTTALVEESQPSLYAFNKPFGFAESKYQPEGRINQAVDTDEIYAEADSIKKPQLIEDITLKTDSSFSSALQNELTIRQLLEEIVAKSRLLSTDVMRDEALTAMETEHLNKLKSNENSSLKVELGSDLKIFENQTSNPNDISKETETSSVNNSVIEELTDIAKDTTNTVQSIDRKKQILLEEMFKKAVMQHYWQHVLKEAKVMEKRKQNNAESVNITKKKELSKIKIEGSKKPEDMVDISISTDKNTLVGDSAKDQSDEKFSIAANKNENYENVIKIEMLKATPKKNPNFVEITSGKDDIVHAILEEFDKFENSKRNNNLTEIFDNSPSNSDLTKNFTTKKLNLTTADIDSTVNQGENIDGDDLLIATINDEDNELSNTDQIYDIQDRSNAIIRILQKNDLQITDVLKNTNEDSPFDLTSVTSEPHPEEIVAMLLDDETLKNQLDFLQQNAPKIKKHKEVLSDKNNLLDNGVLTKNDTELESDFRKAVQEQLHKMGQNIKTVIDFSKLFANKSTVDIAEEVEAEPLRKTNLYNEEQTLELPQYIQFYGDEIDLPESIEQSQILTKPVVSTDHIESMKFKPIEDLTHGANFSTTESSTEITLQFEKVVSPSNSMKSDEITKLVTEKSEKPTALHAKEDFGVTEISNASAITDKPLTEVINSVGKLTETLEKEKEEASFLMNSNQTLTGSSNDMSGKEAITLPLAEQIKEDDTRDKETTESTTIIQGDYLDKENLNETTEYSQLEEVESPSDSVTEELTEKGYISEIESQTTSLVIKNSEEENITESEYAIVDREIATLNTTTAKTIPETKLLENFKGKENSTAFKGNSTTLVQSLKAQDVDETTVYHPFIIGETTTKKAVEKPQKDNSEVSIINMIKYDSTTGSPIFKTEELSAEQPNADLKKTELSEVLEASKLAIKDTFPEEHSTEINLDYAHEFVETTTGAFGTNAAYIEDAAALETTTVRSQLPKLKDESVMNEPISEHKLSTAANKIDLVKKVNIQINIAETEDLKREYSIKKDTKKNTSEKSKLQQKKTEKINGHEEKETKKDYMKLEPIKGQSESIIEEGKVNFTVREKHRENVDSNDNFSVVVKELVQAGTETAQEEPVTKEHNIGVEESTKRNMLEVNLENSEELDKNVSTPSNVEILKETIKKEESKDTKKGNKTEKSPADVKAQAEAESTLQDNKKLSAKLSDNLKTGEKEESTITGNYNLIDITNENLKREKIEHTTVKDSGKLRETNTEELQTVNDNQENEKKLEEATTVENDQVKEEGTVSSSYIGEESEEDMKQTTAVNNDWEKDETVNQMSAEHNEEIEEEYREESAADYDEEFEENTEKSIEIEDANAEDEIIQESTAKDGVIEEKIEESIAVAKDKENIEIMDELPVSYDDYITEDMKKGTSTTNKSPEMIVGSSFEDNNQIKDVLISESLTSDSDKIKEEHTSQKPAKDNEEVKKETLIDVSAKDKDDFKEEMIKEISAEGSDSTKNENPKESSTVDINGNLDLIDEKITLATENSKIKEEKNESLKYEIEENTEDSDKTEAEISEKGTFMGKEPIKIQIIEEMSAESNVGLKEEEFEDYSTVQNKIRVNMSEETKDNDDINGERNKEEINKLVNKEGKEELVKTEEATEPIEEEIIEKPLVRKKIIEEMIEEITPEEIPTENSAGMLKNKVKTDYREDLSDKENDKSVDNSKEELEADMKVQDETKTKNVEDKMKIKIIDETTTEEQNVKEKEMTEDFTAKVGQKLSLVNTDRREPTAKDPEKVQQGIADLSINDKTPTKEELSAVSSDKIKANDAADKWKIKQETTKVAVTVEHNKVKEGEKKTSPNLQKQNQKKKRKNPVQHIKPVIKSNTEEIKNNKTWNNTETKAEVEEDTNNRQHEDILDANGPIPENKKSSESLLVKAAAANIGETYVEEIETVQMDKEKLKRIEINIAKKNSTKNDAEKINENPDELRIILSKKTGLDTFNKDGNLPKITEISHTEIADPENVKIDKGVLKQIELNVAKKQNEKETQQNVTDEGNNQLRIIVTNKENLGTNINQHEDMENKSYSRKQLVTMATNMKAITQTENGQFIRKAENNTAPPKRLDESLMTTETNKKSDSKNIKKKNQQQTNDKNNSIEIQKLNEDVSSTVNCVTTAVEGPTTAATGATAVDIMKIDDADKNNQENSKRLEDIKTRAIKRIGIVMPKQHVEVENNKSIESELNDENNEVAVAAVAVEDDDSDSVDVNDFTDDEMTTLKPVSLTWQQEDNSSMYHQSTKDEDGENEDEEEQQALESDEVDSYVDDDDDDTAAQNDVNGRDSQNEDKVEDMKNVSFKDKNRVFENNINAEEQIKHDKLADSNNDDETNHQTDTLEDNKENVATIATVAKNIDDNTMEIIKNYGNRKIPQKNQIPAADAAVEIVTDDDETHTNAVKDDDDADYDVGDAIGFADTTQYHANKRVQNIEALEEQQSPLSNWWSTLHHAEIRKFLNSIFNDAADEFYQEIARQASEELKEIPQRHGVLNHNRRKGSTSQWLSNVWSLW